VIFGVAAAVAVGCAAVDGTDPYALWETWEHPQGRWHLHYPSPPFALQGDGNGRELVLTVGAPRADADGLIVGGIRLLGRLSTAGPEDVIDDGEQRLGELGLVTELDRSFVGAGGDGGWLIRWRDGARWGYLLAHHHPAGAVVVELEGDLEGVEADAELLLEGVEPRATEGP